LVELHRVPARRETKTWQLAQIRVTPFAIRGELNYFLRMPTEVSIPDAEDLKSRAGELRRFL